MKQLVSFPWTDSGNAERLVALACGDLRFVGAWGHWLRFDGRRWLVDDGAAYRAAKLAAREMLKAASKIDDDKQRAAFSSFALKSESRRGIDAAVALAKHDLDVAVAPEHLDADRWSLNVANGTIDLRTGDLREHQRDDLITHLIPVDYDAQARCPAWIAFLERVLAGNVDVIDFVRRAVGYSLSGDVREQCLFFLLGPGANGKSTFLRIILDLLAAYARQAAPELLLARKGDAHPTEQADLFGSRLVVCTEIEAGRAFAEVTVKQLTGGDLVKARRMREDFWSFAPTHKIWIAANHKPVVRGTDLAIWRRIRLVPFDVKIPAEERDPMLLEKLRGELPGILRWAVEGCLSWQARGLDAPDAVKNATEAYRVEQDVVGAFIDAACVIEAGALTAAGELFASYERWCEANGERSVAPKTFGQRLQERGLTPKKGNGGKRIWVGIRLDSGASGACGATSRFAAQSPLVGVNPETRATTRHTPLDEVQ